MRSRSPKRSAEMRVYVPRMLAFLEEHRWCRRCGVRPATEVHHRKGRRGPLLLDERWWAASCRGCNDFAETHTGQALEEGWLVRTEQEEDPWTSSP